MANTLFPANVDLSNPAKNIGIVYDPKVLYGTIAVGGSVSTPFDLDGWTNFALEVIPTGTFLGTVLTVYAAAVIGGPYVPVAGTTGVVSSTLQIGSVNGQVISPLPQLNPLRFVQFVAPGTQAAAQVLALFVK